MQDINLLPDSILYKNKRTLTIAGRIAAGIIIAFILAVLLLFKTYTRIDLQSRIDALNKEINQSSLKELNAAQDKLKARKAELEEVKKLYSDVPTREILVNKLLDKVSALMPQSVTAEDIEYKGEGETLTLEITSGSKEDMVLFLKRLHNDPAFVDVNISVINSLRQGYNSTVTIGVSTQTVQTEK